MVKKIPGLIPSVAKYFYFLILTFVGLSTLLTNLLMQLALGNSNGYVKQKILVINETKPDKNFIKTESLGLRKP
jgi:hypothetical protein